MQKINGESFNLNSFFFSFQFFKNEREVKFLMNRPDASKELEEYLKEKDEEEYRAALERLGVLFFFLLFFF